MIPRIIHAFWGGGRIPKEWTRCIDRWSHLHPDWDLRVWSPETVGHLGPLQPYWDDPERWSPKSNVWQHRTNLLRYNLLSSVGGVWVDVDLEPLTPINDILDDEDRLIIAWEKQDLWLNNAFMASPPYHPAIINIIAQLPHFIESKPNLRSNRQSGGKYMTPILRNRGDVRILDECEVYPYAWNETQDICVGEDLTDKFNGARMVHHWANQRRQLNAGV